MKIYHYHPITKEYLKEGKAKKSPLDDEWLIPAHATVIELPDEIEGMVRRFVADGENSHWEYVAPEVIAQTDTTNTSPATETAFTKAQNQISNLNTKVEELTSELLLLKNKIVELETPVEQEEMVS